MDYRQLLPEPATVEIGPLLETLDLTSGAPSERPYTVVNFIASADGRSTIQGRSGGLGDEGDRAMFHGLREQVDAVLVGTGTLRAERYGRILGNPERRERRTRRGLSPEPLATIFTRTGAIPREAPLFAEPEAHVVVFTNARADTTGLAARVDVVVLDPGELTLTTMMRRLRRDYGVASVLCEGGAMLFGVLLLEDLVDELFLTVAPKLTGGGNGPTITTGPELDHPRELELAWLLERENALYHRYRLRPRVA